jgi:glycosyltransferase involved in cell wall biosynthesis
MKSVFVIPSWYPSEIDPVSGIFIKNQVEAIRRYTDYIPIVALWGQCDENLPLNRLGRLLPWLRNYQKQENSKRFVESGVSYIFHKTFSWSHRLPFGGAERILDSVRRSLKQAIDQSGRIDLIHAYVSYPAGFIASVLSRETGIPYMITEFMGPFPFPVHCERSGRPRKEIRDALIGSHRNIVLSEYLRHRFVELGFDEPTIIPFSVNTELFAVDRKANDIIEVVTCSRMVVQKGVFDLLQAFEAAVKVNPRLRLTMIGDGEALPDLKRLTDKKGLSARLRFTGALNNREVAKIFSKSHFFVLASHFDTFGVVFIEALSSGLPIVGTKCGGPESFIGNQHGLLVNVTDIAQLSDALVEMAANYEKYDGQKIRQYAIDCFSEQAVSTAVTKQYDAILSY